MPDIDVAHVQQYDRNVVHAYQQDRATLSGSTREISVTGKMWNVEKLAAVSMVQTTVRHGPTMPVNPDHTRRRGFITDWNLPLLVDEEDIIKVLMDPQSEYTRLAAMAWARRHDETVIGAFMANATTVLPSTGGTDTEGVANIANFVGAQSATANHIIPQANNSGLTIANIAAAKRMLDIEDVPQENRYALTSPYGAEDLLANTTYTSVDYNTVKALVDGSIADRTWYGFKWIVNNRVPIVANNQYTYFWHRDSLVTGQSGIPKSSVDKRPDLLNAMQILWKLSIGCVRVQEAGVVAVEIFVG